MFSVGAVPRQSLRTLLVAFVFLSSCARRPQMSVAGYDARQLRPAPGKALVMFLRPGRYFGKAIGSSLYDGEAFLGLPTTETAIAYQATPGRHIFMLLSGQPAAPAFLEADLVPDRTYYVEIGIRSKWTRPPFHLVPRNPKEDPSELEEWLREAHLLVMDEGARLWDRSNRPSVDEKRAVGLRRWHEQKEHAVMDASYGADPPPSGIAFSSVPAEPSEASRSAPPPQKETAANAEERLKQLERLHEKGLLTDDEYGERRRAIIDAL